MRRSAESVSMNLVLLSANWKTDWPMQTDFRFTCPLGRVVRFPGKLEGSNGGDSCPSGKTRNAAAADVEAAAASDCVRRRERRRDSC